MVLLLLLFVQKWLIGKAAAISLPETGLYFGYNVFCFGLLVISFVLILGCTLSVGSDHAPNSAFLTVTVLYYGAYTDYHANSRMILNLGLSHVEAFR